MTVDRSADIAFVQSLAALLGGGGVLLAGIATVLWALRPREERPSWRRAPHTQIRISHNTILAPEALPIEEDGAEFSVCEPEPDEAPRRIPLPDALPLMEDIIIRGAGYTIHKRPASGAAWWRAPDGKIVRHITALDRAMVAAKREQEAEGA